MESVRTQCLVAEELAWGDAPIGSLVTSGGFFAGPIVALGTEEQRERWIPPLCTDRPPMAALAITEPGAGSDAAAITTTARRVGDGYVLDGSKTWVSGAPRPSCTSCTRRWRPARVRRASPRSSSRQGDQGFTIGRKLPKMGSRCYPTAELFFADCLIPDDRRIGEEGQGFYGRDAMVRRDRA